MKHLLIILILSASQAGLFAQTLPQGFVMELFVEGINQPVQLDQAPDGRIFVAERTGKIRIIENGILLEEPFYEVQTETPGERGVTGLKLHPAFEENGWVYIYHTIPDSNRNRLIRVQASGNTASPSTEEELFLLDPMWAAWHNGGGMVFDDEGYLILGVGDGTGWQSATQMNTTLGKVLRLHDDGTIPTDNPFNDVTFDDQQAIYGVGIRNPYCMAKQKSTGRIFFNDVGNDEWEEVNEVIEGAHYGWGFIEGPIQPGQTAPEGYEDPVFAYDHSEGCAIVGADFYEPDLYTFPEEYHHKYLYIEHCLSQVFTIDPETAERTLFIEGMQYPNNLKVLQDGSMLVTEVFNNRIFKITYTGSSLPNVVLQPTPQTAIPGEEASFYVTAISNLSLSYQWYRNGIALSGMTEAGLVLSDVAIEENGDTFYCEVSNTEGSVLSQSVALTVIEDTRPTVDIILPVEGGLYSAGDTLWFQGIAEDVEDGSLDPSSWEWNIFFHHNVHQHSALTQLHGVSEGYYVIPNSGEVATDVWFSVSLKVSDSVGLTAEANSSVYPELVEFEVQSNPAGIGFTVDGSVKTAEETVLSVKNMERTLAVEEFVIHNNQLLMFDEWNSGIEETSIELAAVDTVLHPQYVSLHEYLLGDNSEDVTVRYFIGHGESREFFREELVGQIDENWSLQSPFSDTEPFPEDYYSIVYTGSILAPYTGLYTLQVLHDSRISITLEDSLLMVAETPVSYTDPHEVEVMFEAGNRYNFVVDYEHVTEFSRIKLAWAFSQLPFHTIPSEQLYQSYIEPTGENYLTNIAVFPNPSVGPVVIDFKGYFYTWYRENGRIEIFDVLGHKLDVIGSEIYQNKHSLQGIKQLPPGVYMLNFIAGKHQRLVKLMIIE